MGLISISMATLCLILILAIMIFDDDDEDFDSNDKKNYSRFIIRNYYFFFKCYFVFENGNVTIENFKKLLKDKPKLCNIIAEKYLESKYSVYSIDSDWSHFIREESSNKNASILLRRCIEKDLNG